MVVESYHEWAEWRHHAWQAAADHPLSVLYWHTEQNSLLVNSRVRSTPQADGSHICLQRENTQYWLKKIQYFDAAGWKQVGLDKLNMLVFCIALYTLIAMKTWTDIKKLKLQTDAWNK